MVTLNSSAWQNRAAAPLIAAVIIVVGIHAAPLGLSSHEDSRAILERSIPAILNGHYAISRSYGNPLYEFMAAGLHAAGGYIWINFYSLLLATASLCIFGRLLGDTFPPERRAIALAALAFSPLFLVNIATTIEWMQLVFLLLCLLCLVRHWLDNPGPAVLAGIGLLSALIVLTRPDAALVCASVFGAAWWHVHTKRRALQLLFAMVTGGVVALAVFGSINGGFAFIRPEIFGNASLTRRFIISVIGVFSVFGPAGAVIMAVMTAYVARAALRGQEGPSFWSKLFLVGFPLIMLRFIMLPDKLEYIISLPIFFLLMAAHAQIRTFWLAVAAAAMIQPSLVNLSLFERLGTEDTLSVRLHVTPGAVAQEWRMTYYNHLVTEPAFLADIANSVYGSEPLPHPLVRAILYRSGLTGDTGDLIIGRQEAYRLDNSRIAEKESSSLYRRIYICDKSVFGGNLGWRQMQPPVDLPLPDANGRIALHCERRI